MDGAASTSNPESRIADDGSPSFISNNAQTQSTTAPTPQPLGQQNLNRHSQRIEEANDTEAMASTNHTKGTRNLVESINATLSSTAQSIDLSTSGPMDANRLELDMNSTGDAHTFCNSSYSPRDFAVTPKVTPTAGGLLDDHMDMAGTYNDSAMNCRNCGDLSHQTSACTRNCGNCGKIDHRHHCDAMGKGCCPSIQLVCGCNLFPGHKKEDCQEKCTYFLCNTIDKTPHTIWQCTVQCFKCGSFEHLGNVCPTTHSCLCGKQHYGYIHGGRNGAGCMVPGCGLFLCTTHCDICGMVKSRHPQGICTSTITYPWIAPIPCGKDGYTTTPRRWRKLLYGEQKHEYAFGDPGGCWLCVHEKTSQIKHMAIDADDSNWKKRLDTLVNMCGGGEWVAFIRWQEGHKEEAEKIINGLLLNCILHTFTTYPFDAPNGCPQCHTEKMDEIKQLATDQRSGSNAWIVYTKHLVAVIESNSSS
ncbi:uncharacterized protein PAC_14437 [Phialocephala subalpina]|uniref:CCHC-type domain-containing protein n=1 Tax=Phialocephala subalpina TaxID=576137 RepID=A0A1L7XHL7_9HELO|nr:uncharacterized protein PAC_14437 [Phialocephala subalpina]